MPISAECPECGARYNLAESMAGKKITCKKCDAAFAVPQADADDDDVPAGRSRRARRAMDDDDRDDRDDDRPARPSRPAKTSGGVSTVLIILGGVFLVLLLLCGGAIGFFVWGVRQASNAVVEGAKKINEQIEQERKKQAQLPTVAATPITLDPNGAYTDNGTLSMKALLDAGRPAKVYKVRLEPGRTYQFDLMSKDFDSLLHLFGPNNTLLQVDDDGGGNLNSRIRWSVTQPGEYTIRATCLTSINRDPASFTFLIRRQ